jgi:hypothetical protein
MTPLLLQSREHSKNGVIIYYVQMGVRVFDVE